MEPWDVIFQVSPVVTIGGNHFNCPTVIQYCDVPLMQVGRIELAGYTTKFAIYHNDGTKIAIVKGSRIIRTPDGIKADLKQRTGPDLTAIELDGKTLFELHRKGAAALKGWAELYAPEGVFIKVTDSETAALLNTGGSLTAGGITMIGNRITAPIGILFDENGGVAIGANRPSPPIE